jgi:hypothetical protein
MLGLKNLIKGECCPYDQINLIHMLHISQLDKQNIVSFIIRVLEP